jgi:hypothetical protein
MASVNGVSFQDELVSGTNIKTINSSSLLGSGNLSVNGGVNGFQFCEVIPNTGTSVVSSTTETITYSALVPANTFGSGGILDLTARIIKTGQTSTMSSFVYINSTPSLTGATLIATGFSALSAVNIYGQYNRIFRIANGILGAYPFSTASYIDYTNSTIAESTTSFNINVDNYILISVKLGSNSDTISGAMLKLFAYE